jgi:hypothetical protein
MANSVFVVGVGMTKFEKPGRREGWDYPQLAADQTAVLTHLRRLRSGHSGQ